MRPTAAPAGPPLEVFCHRLSGASRPCSTLGSPLSPWSQPPSRAATRPRRPVLEARPVRTVTVEQPADGEIVSLTGQIRAKDQVSLAFRLDGRMLERPVHVGDTLTAGQVVARLDPQIQRQCARRRAANLAVGPRRCMTQARLTFSRQQRTLQGRLDGPRQIRRGPADASDRRGPSRPRRRRRCGSPRSSRAIRR